MVLTKKITDVIRAIVRHLALTGELLVTGRIIRTGNSGQKNGEQKT